TMNLLAAAGAPGSSVRKVVLKSSTLIYGSSPKDPYFFGEEAGRSGPARTRVERSLLEVEGYLSDFADDHPDVVVSRLRFSNVLGPDLDTPLSKALRLPVVPEIFGFDPRLQFTHQDDVLGALCFAARHDAPGIFNVAGDGTVTWSDVCRIVGRRRVPISPVGTGVAAGALRRCVAGLGLSPMEIRDLVVRDLVTVGPAHTLAQAAKLMNAKRVGSAIVLTEESPGILSERDVLRAVADGADPTVATVGD